MRPGLLRLLGDDEVGRRAADFLMSSRAERIVQSYGSEFNLFCELCAHNGRLSDMADPPLIVRSSHSFRSGGASAASAAGVPVPTVRWLGGWAVGSGVVLNYIVLGILDSAGARYSFGFLAPQRSAADLSQ
eukprot:jgi/Tetstr1/460503/TSEL_005762.t1